MSGAPPAAPTRVDFYVLQSGSPDSRLYFACRLAEKAYKMSHRVYAHTLSAATARQFDDLLWNFRQGSFVPHEILAGTPPASPVCIGTETNMLESGELLLNLADAAPEFALQFARVAEIVSGAAADKQAARARFKHYKALGLEPETHKIAA